MAKRTSEMSAPSRWAALAALVALLALGGCGGDDDGGSEPSAEAEVTTSATDSGLDPCSLLTEDEVATAIGESRVTAEPGRGDLPAGLEEASCAWTGPAPAGDPIATAKMVVLDIYPDEQYHGEAENGIAVSGVGEQAAINPPLDAIQWLQDGRTYQLQYTVLNGTPTKELESLAKQAAGRIG